MEKYPGVTEAMKSIGYDVLDGSSMQEVFTFGYLAGKTAADIETCKLLKSIDGDLNYLNQAE